MMSIYLGFSLLLLHLCSSLPASRANEVHIAAFIDENSHIGRERAVAIEVAVQDFNSSINNLSRNISDLSSKAESIINDWGANVIISTEPWPEVVQIAKIANKTGIPVFDLATYQPPSIVPKPYVFQLSYFASDYIQCLTDLIKLYNWREVVVLYEDDEYGSISASVPPLINDALRAIRCEINTFVAFPPHNSLSNPNDLVHHELTKLTKHISKVFIIVHWSSPSSAINLFKQAKTLGLMDKGHVWIAGDDITTLLDSTSFTPSFIQSYMQGVLGVKTYFNESTKPYTDFKAKFQQRFQAKYGEIGEANIEPGIHAMRAYDVVHLITILGDQNLPEGIRSTTFKGLSGEIQFTKEQSILNGKGSSAATYRVINVVGKSYREMGFWLKGRGFYGDETELRQGGGRRVVDWLGPVYWPGGAVKVPGGWGKLRIGVPIRSDEFVNVEYDKDGRMTNVSGFCIDVFKMARKQLKYELPYEFIPFNGTYNDLVASVPEVFDGAIGDITILAKRSENASFTEPYLPSGLTRLVRLKPDHAPWMLSKPFTNQVWFLILASLIYNCFCIWYLEHRRNPEFDGPWWIQVGAALWNTFSSIFFANRSPHSYYTKVVIVVWFFVVWILTSSFIASLGSILNSQKWVPVVRDDRVGCDAHSFVVNYLQDVLGYKQEQIKEIAGINDYAQAFESGLIESAYLETPYAQVFLKPYDGYTVYGETHNLGGFGFVFPKESPLASDFSRAILELSENGELKQLENKWFSLSFTSCPSLDTNRYTDRLGLDSFWALFIMTGVTNTIVVLLFKAHSILGYVHHTWTLCVPLRERCMRFWLSKLRNRKVHQLSHGRPISLQRTVPEPPPQVVLDRYHRIHGDIEE